MAPMMTLREWAVSLPRLEKKQDLAVSLDPEDPRKPHILVVGNQLADRTSNARPHVRGPHEERHCLARDIGRAEEVRDCAGDVGERCAACRAAEELEDDEHREIERFRRALTLVSFLWTRLNGRHGRTIFKIAYIKIEPT